MKLPDSAVKQIEKMVHSFLPYEVDYMSETSEAKLVEELYTAIATASPQLRQWSGFVMFILKQIDTHPEKQKDVRDVAASAHRILESYGCGREEVR